MARRIPEKYLRGVSPADRRRQLTAIRRARSGYPRGAYVGRPRLASYRHRQSPHVRNFRRRYGVSLRDAAAVAAATGLTPRAQTRILRKGKGAYYSSGSRPGQTPSSWAYARLASVALGRKACAVDANLLPRSLTCAGLRRKAKSEK